MEILTIELTRSRKCGGKVRHIMSRIFLSYDSLKVLYPTPAKAPLANADHAGVAAVPTAVQGKDEKFLARAEREQISVAGEDI